MMMYGGFVCELMIMYTSEYKPIYNDIFASESKSRDVLERGGTYCTPGTVSDALGGNNSYTKVFPG